MWIIPLPFFKDVQRHWIPDLKVRNVGYVVNIKVMLVRWDVLNGFCPHLELSEDNCCSNFICDGFYAVFYHHSLSFSCNFSSVFAAGSFLKDLLHVIDVILDLDLIFDSLVFHSSEFSDSCWAFDFISLLFLPVSIKNKFFSERIRFWIFSFDSSSRIFPRNDSFCQDFFKFLSVDVVVFDESFDSQKYQVKVCNDEILLIMDKVLQFLLNYVQKWSIVGYPGL